MNIYSAKRLKCPDFFNRHKKCVYKSEKVMFIKLNDFALKVTSKFHQIPAKSSDSVCSNCYNYIKNITEGQEIHNIEQEHDINDEEINVIENENNSEDFSPSTPELIREINSQILSLTENSVSPLKPRYELNQSPVENYVSRKRTEIVTSFSDATNAKLQKVYHVSNEEPKSSKEPSCDDWINNFAIALKNSSSISEKVRLLTLLPVNYTKAQILNYFPDITSYMINKARKMMKTKGIYAEPDIYSGHPLDEKIKEIALSYYLNDYLDCSRQSPNTRDVITVKEYGQKQEVAKRFLTRSIKEIYDIFKRDNPGISISISAFYALRPKHVSLDPINQVCLCVYCANFDLYLAGLQNFLEVSNSELKIIRSDVLAALTCNPPSEACFLQDCVSCPGVKGITTKVLRLPGESKEEEITFAVWSKGELIKKTLSVSNFMLEFAEWAYKVNVHIYVKDIQRNAIKMEKELAISNFAHLVIQVDFAENWSVLTKNAVQSNHWQNKQVSIFTAVCHQGNKKKVMQLSAMIASTTRHTLYWQRRKLLNVR